MESAHNLGFSPEFMMKYSKSSDNKDRDKGIPHIWALCNSQKLISLKKRLLGDGFTEEEISAGWCYALPKIDQERRKSDIQWYENRETGENIPSIHIQYIRRGTKTKSYTHGCKTTVSFFELMTLNNSELFAIDTRSFMKDEYKNIDKTNPMIKDMSAGSQSFSIINRVKSNPEIAKYVKSYKDLLLIPCSDLTVSKIDNGEDKTITVPLTEFFVPLSASNQEMYDEYMKESGALEMNEYLDNIRI